MITFSVIHQRLFYIKELNTNYSTEQLHMKQDSSKNEKEIKMEGERWSVHFIVLLD